MGRWRCGLSLLIASDDPGTTGRTRSRICVFEGLDSAAFLYACSCHLSLVSCRCYVLPGGPRRVMAKPEEVGTGSRLSGTTGGIMWDALVAMASMAGGVNGLWVAITVHRRSLSDTSPSIHE